MTLFEIMSILQNYIGNILVPVLLGKDNENLSPKQKKRAKVILVVSSILVVLAIVSLVVWKKDGEMFFLGPMQNNEDSVVINSTPIPYVESNTIGYTDSPFQDIQYKRYDKMYQQWMTVDEEEIDESSLHMITIVFEDAVTDEDYVYVVSVPPYDVKLTLGVFDEPVTILASKGHYEFGLATYINHQRKILYSGMVWVDESKEHVIISNTK